jgi:hypothetical protein
VSATKPQLDRYQQVRLDQARRALADAPADEHAEAAWIAATIDRLLGCASFHSLDSK